MRSFAKGNICQAKQTAIMKRNINLIELSRDHHHGLLLGWKIKQGFKRNVAIGELVKYIDHFAHQALFPHFEEEENQLLGFLSDDDDYSKRLLKEHSEIKNLVLELTKPNIADKAGLQILVDKVEAHIRFEEREMFPYIEKTLSDADLDKLGKLISDVHQPYEENYTNKFWVN